MSVIINNPKEFREQLRKKIYLFIKNKNKSINLEKAVFIIQYNKQNKGKLLENGIINTLFKFILIDLEVFIII